MKKLLFIIIGVLYSLFTYSQCLDLDYFEKQLKGELPKVNDTITITFKRTFDTNYYRVLSCSGKVKEEGLRMAKITVCRAYSNFDKDYYDFFMVDDDVCLIPEKMFGKICSQCDEGHAIIRNFPFNNDIVGKISFSKKSLVMKREDDSIVEYVYMDNL